MAVRLLPVRVGLAVADLRAALRTLQTAVDTPSDLEVVLQRIGEARVAAEALDALVGEGDVLHGHRLLQHLGFAERLARRGHSPDQDAHDLVAHDLKDVAARVRTLVPEPPRSEEVRRALTSLEGPDLEFTLDIPRNAQSLAKELAALAPKGGSLLIGVDDHGRPAGLQVTSTTDVDRFELRLRGLMELVEPPVRAEVYWFAADDRVFLEVLLPPSNEPIHYVDYRPYVRDGSQSRPARPEEVRRAIREYDGRSAQEVVALNQIASLNIVERYLLRDLRRSGELYEPLWTTYPQPGTAPFDDQEMQEAKERLIALGMARRRPAPPRSPFVVIAPAIAEAVDRFEETFGEITSPRRISKEVHDRYYQEMDRWRTEQSDGSGSPIPVRGDQPPEAEDP